MEKSFSKIDLQTDFWPQVVIGEVRPEPAWAVVGHEKLSCWLHLSHNLQIFGKLKFEFLISNVKICGSGDLSPLRAGIAGGGNLAPTPHTLVSIPTFKNTKFKNLFSEIQILIFLHFMILCIRSPDSWFVGKGEQTTTAESKFSESFCTVLKKYCCFRLFGHH